MIEIKILFAARPDLFNLKAGDTFQIKALQNELEKIGVKVKISTEIKPDLSGIDLVHSFNFLRARFSLSQCKWFKANNMRVVLTPVYWNLEEYLSFNSPERLAVWAVEQKRRQKIIDLVDHLAPNGEKELMFIKKDFKFDISHTFIYNGVYKEFLNKNPFNKRENILSVGRIHPRKNQLNMIKAVKKLKLPVIFIGRVNDRNYFKRCVREAEGSLINFRSEMPQSELKKYYKRSRLHMMVSWYDTPGLVNLEAGLSGCNLVLTDRGTTTDYFGEAAFYSSPRDLNSIAQNVKKAYYLPPDSQIQEMILNNYTWKIISAVLKNMYLDLI